MANEPVRSLRLQLSPEARAAAVRDLGPGETLRIAFAGGCGAMGFRLAAARKMVDGDLLLEIDGIPVALDSRAATELDGATLLYDEDEGLVLDHPSWGVSC
jgi:Fe-S cluster assembly iron-binding protein IscA